MGSWAVVLLGAGIGAVLLAAGLGFLRRLERRRADEVLRRFDGARVLGATSNANYFGTESLGRGQLRGNGVMVLTEDALHYEMWAPIRSVRIPVSRMVRTENARSHLGRSVLRPLLKVVFENDRGETDSCAWLVRDVETWRRALSSMIAARRAPEEADAAANPPRS